MKVYECGICANTYTESRDGSYNELSDDWSCPVCGASKQNLQPIGEANIVPISAMSVDIATAGSAALYQCSICGNTHDEGKSGKYSGLSECWCCPVCGAPKQGYQQISGLHRPKESPPISEAERLANQVRTSRTEEFLGGQKTNVYECNVCSTIYDEGSESCSFELLDDNWTCPVCGAAKPAFVLVQSKDSGAACQPECHCEEANAQPRTNPPQEMETTEPFAIEPRRAQLTTVSWNDILLLDAQLSPFPLDADAAVDTQTTLGKRAAKPLVLDLPVYLENTQNGSVLEYVPGSQSALPEHLKQAGAIEIRLEPRPESNIHNRDDLKALVCELRQQCEGLPIGIKLIAGHIEQDLEVAAYAEADFVAIQAGNAGAVPAIFALYRARKYLDENNLETELVMADGLHTAADMMKALCLGANVVAIKTTPEKPAEHDLQKLKEAITTFCRTSGHDKTCYLSVWDICTTNSEISMHTNVPHV